MYFLHMFLLFSPLRDDERRREVKREENEFSWVLFACSYEFQWVYVFSCYLIQFLRLILVYTVVRGDEVKREVRRENVGSSMDTLPKLCMCLILKCRTYFSC